MRSPMNAPSRCLSVVMPVYNEVSTLRTILSRVFSSPYVQEIVLVDDFSTDGTRDLLKAHERGEKLLVEASSGPSLRVFYQPVNQGKSAALRVGIAQAKAPYLIVQDADLEYDPAEFSRVLEPLLGGRADVVYGSRFLNDAGFSWHTAMNRSLTAFSNLFTGLNLTDMETCYKAFKTDILQKIPIRANRFGFEPEVTAKVAKLGCRVLEVPISYNRRSYAEGKKINWRDGVSALFTIIRFAIINDTGEAR